MGEVWAAPAFRQTSVVSPASRPGQQEALPIPQLPIWSPQYTPLAKDYPDARPRPGPMPALQATSRHVSANQQSLWALSFPATPASWGRGPCPSGPWAWQKLSRAESHFPAGPWVRLEAGGSVGSTTAMATWGPRPWCEDCSPPGLSPPEDQLMVGGTQGAHSPSG